MQTNLTLGRRLSQLEVWVRKLQKQILNPVETNSSTTITVGLNPSQRDELNSSSVVLAKVIDAGVKNSFLTVGTAGALSTATNNKNGNFDQWVVTGGDNTSELIFPGIKICDNRAVLKAKIKVDSYRTNASLSSLIGLVCQGIQSSNDTGSVYTFTVLFDLPTKKVYYFDANDAVFVEITSLATISSGFAVASGDIVELTLQRKAESNTTYASIVNTSNGEYIEVSYSVEGGGASAYMGIQNEQIGFSLTNGSYTLVDYTVKSSVPERPLLGIIGDSYASGFDNVPSELFPWLLLNDTTNFPYNVFMAAGNGAYIISMAKFQMQDIFKMKPKYVLFISILSVYYGFFKSGDGDNTIFTNMFNDIIKGILSYGGIPVLALWQSGANGYLNDNGTDWNTFVAASQVTYPQIKTLDLTNEDLVLDLDGHPNPADHLKIKNKVIEFFKTEGLL